MAEQEEAKIEETLDNGEETVEEEKVIPEIDSKYRMIILAAQRAKQLQKGAHPRVDMDPRKHKNTRIALRELEEKTVYFDILEN